jgi:asparagine synthase (glutamine-hydrolysing)
VESVQAHMVSDVPVGIFLSGGIDSAAIVAAVREFYEGPLQTFTLAFPGTSWDEGEAARKTARYFHTEHIEMEITAADFEASLDPFFKCMDQPTIDGMNTFFVAKMARRAGLKVALSGLGGDEILGGYESFTALPRLYRFLQKIQKVPGAISAAQRLSRLLPFSSAPKLQQILEAWPETFEELWRDYRAVFTRKQIKALGFSVISNDAENPNLRNEMDAFSKINLLEMNYFMIPQLLRDSDVFTMAHGLELRTPFVDLPFLKAVFAAGRWRKGGAPSYKAALFHAMGKFLPASLFDQKKRGFVLPFEKWLRGSFLKSENVFAFHPHLMRQFKSGRLHWSRLWALYVLGRMKHEVV